MGGGGGAGLRVWWLAVVIEARRRRTASAWRMGGGAVGWCGRGRIILGGSRLADAGCGHGCGCRMCGGARGWQVAAGVGGWVPLRPVDVRARQAWCGDWSRCGALGDRADRVMGGLVARHPRSMHGVSWRLK